MDMFNIFSQYVTQNKLMLLHDFFVLPIDIENKSTIESIKIYI